MARRKKAPTGPLILAVDTATLTQSVSLSAGLELLASTTIALPRGHSQRLLRSIDQTLANYGVEMDAIDAIAVGLGPGSFTGLRIGLALCKGLAHSFDKPLVGASSLRALAAPLHRLGAELVCPCVDARKGEVYTTLIDSDGSELLAECVIPPRDLGEALLFHAGDRPIHFAGTGAAVYEDTLRASFGARAHLVPTARPSALEIARLALSRVSAGQFDEIDSLEPRYIRPSEAEIGAASRASTRTP